MAGDGYQRVGKNGKPQKRHARDWKCNVCSGGKPEAEWHFVFKIKEKCNLCGKVHTKASILYENPKLGKIDIANRRNGSEGGGGRAAGGAKGGGKGGGMSGGKGGGSDSEQIRKLEADKKRLAEELRKEKASKTCGDDGGEEEDEEMGDDLKTKDDWDRVVAQAEADVKYGVDMLKKYLKSPRYLGLIDGARAQAEEAREKIRELRSPTDQLRHKLERERKLGLKVARLKDGIKEHLLIVAEAEDEAASLREQLHEAMDEIEQIESQKLLLVSLAGAKIAPVDIAQCVTAMRDGLGEMFDDQRLSSEARAKRAEVEAGFRAMQALAGTLASIQAEYEAAKLAAATVTGTADSSNGGAAPVPTAGEGAVGGPTVQTGEAAVQAGEGQAAPATVETGAVPAAVLPAPVAVPDGPPQERTASRERTPPPGGPGQRAKAIEKMSEAELAGPRKAKKGAAKAGTIVAA